MPEPDQVVVAIEAGGVGFVDTLCVHGTYQALPALPWVPGCELAGTVVAVGDDGHAVRGRRPRAQHVVDRELPDPRGAARRRARTGAGAADRRAGRGTGRVLRHDVVRVHSPHDAGRGRVGRGARCGRRGRARGHGSRDGDGRASARVRVELREARARGACRRRGHRRLLRSRARPEGRDPRAHRRWCRRRGRPRRWSAGRSRRSGACGSKVVT